MRLESDLPAHYIRPRLSPSTMESFFTKMTQHQWCNADVLASTCHVSPVALCLLHHCTLWSCFIPYLRAHL